MERAAKERRPTTLPGLDVAALQQKYRPDRGDWPRAHEATFRVSVDLDDAQYQQIRKDAIGKFLTEMHRRGWDLYTAPGCRPRVYPGICPARDLLSGKDLPGTREMIVRIWFRLRRPEAQRVEIPSHLLAARTVGG